MKHLKNIKKKSLNKILRQNNLLRLLMRYKKIKNFSNHFVVTNFGKKRGKKTLKTLAENILCGRE